LHEALVITARRDDAVDDLFRSSHESVLGANLAVLRIPDKRLVTRAKRAEADIRPVDPYRSGTAGHPDVSITMVYAHVLTMGGVGRQSPCGSTRRGGASSLSGFGGAQ
jgi:hypothetical protein